MTDTDKDFYRLLAGQMKIELLNDILPFWATRMDDGHGGFHPRMDGCGNIIPDEPRGGILNSRILWTFSAAFRMFQEAYLKETASKAFAQIRDNFYDPVYGGIYWSIGPYGLPADPKKQFYAIAFAIYGLSEYYRATGCGEALDLAVKLYNDIETHSRDKVLGGYLEAAGRDWSPLEDMRLSEKDRNDAKTMNTHLHILEAYANLYRVWPDSDLGRDLKALIELFLERIIRPDGHLGLFFDADWHSTSKACSYGHDIETSWLLLESADILGDTALSEKVREASTRLAEASLEGLQPSGGMFYDFDPETGETGDYYEWWVQAELVVGCVTQHILTDKGIWFERALDAWEFIKAHIICPKGEWYWGASKDLEPDTVNDRAGFWKCPYHSGRMCMEITRYARALLPDGTWGLPL